MKFKFGDLVEGESKFYGKFKGKVIDYDSVTYRFAEKYEYLILITKGKAKGQKVWVEEKEIK